MSRSWATLAALSRASANFDLTSPVSFSAAVRPASAAFERFLQLRDLTLERDRRLLDLRYRSIG